MSRKWNETEFDDGISSKKQVNVNLNGDFDNGRNMHIESDWTIEDFLNFASQRMEMAMTAKRVFSADGVEVDDCMMFEDEEILFLSTGDEFIPPLDENDREGSAPSSSAGDAALPKVVNGYKVTDFLGKGGFGEVRLGEHQVTGERVALKFLRKADIMTIGEAERTTTEIQCLMTLKHQNIIRLYSHVESPLHYVLVFEVMEGGDLHKYMIKKGRETKDYGLPEDKARDLFGQILSAVSYAHNHHICHRDLKLENILLKDKELREVKIGDFGLSDFYRPGAMVKSSCGTLSFLAPEVFRGTNNAGPPLDVWSLGVILFAVLCGRLPFEAHDMRNTAKPREAVIRARIMKCQYKLDEKLGPEVKDLIRRMLKLDPTERATVPEIASHVWLRARNLTNIPTSASGSVAGLSDMTADDTRETVRKPEGTGGPDAQKSGSREVHRSGSDGLSHTDSVESDVSALAIGKRDGAASPVGMNLTRSGSHSDSRDDKDDSKDDSKDDGKEDPGNDDFQDSFKLRPLRRMPSKSDLRDDLPVIQSSAAAAAAARAAGSEAKSEKLRRTDSDERLSELADAKGTGAGIRHRGPVPATSSPIAMGGSPKIHRRHTTLS